MKAQCDNCKAPLPSPGRCPKCRGSGKKLLKRLQPALVRRLQSRQRLIAQELIRRKAIQDIHRLAAQGAFGPDARVEREGLWPGPGKAFLPWDHLQTKTILLMAQKARQGLRTKSPPESPPDTSPTFQ